MSGEATPTAPATLDDALAVIAGLRAETSNLRAETTGLAGQLRAANAESADRRHKLREAEASIGTLTGERDRFRSLAETTPDEWKAKFTAADGELRGIRHGGVFDDLAKQAGITTPDRLEALRTLSGWKPGDGDPDPQAIGSAIQTTLGKFSWLKATPAGADGAGGHQQQTAAAGAAAGGAGAQNGGQVATGQPGPGADRGQSPQSTPSRPAGRIPGRL